MIQHDKRNERPEAYPKPTETDRQLNQQDEYIAQAPNKDTDLSSTPSGKDTAEGGSVRQPTEDTTESIP